MADAIRPQKEEEEDDLPSPLDHERNDHDGKIVTEKETSKDDCSDLTDNQHGNDEEEDAPPKTFPQKVSR